MAAREWRMSGAGEECLAARRNGATPNEQRSIHVDSD
jgi:hypothetical protein